MKKEDLEKLNILLAKFFHEEAEGQGKPLKLKEYDCEELLTAIQEKLSE